MVTRSIMKELRIPQTELKEDDLMRYKDAILERVRTLSPEQKGLIMSKGLIPGELDTTTKPIRSTSPNDLGFEWSDIECLRYPERLNITATWVLLATMWDIIT